MDLRTITKCPPFFEISGATIRKNGRIILEDFNWKIEEGQQWAIIGPVGAGKSMLLEAITGDADLISGSLDFHFQSDDLNANSSLYSRVSRNVACVNFKEDSKSFSYSRHYYQQRFNAFDSDDGPTAAVFLQAGGFCENDPSHQEIIQILGLESLLNVELIKLSNGQTRRLMIAKALMRRPELLLLDNPYIGLDVAGRTALNNYLDCIILAGKIKIILVAAQTDIPERITHVLLLDHEGIVKAGKKEEVLPLAGKKPLPGISESSAELKDRIKKLLKNYQDETLFNTIFSLKQTNISYNHKKILDGINWTVRQGEKWALLGPNGSGKSTIISLIYADNPQAYANELILFDHRRGTGESIWDIKKNIGFTSPELHLYFDGRFTCSEVVITGLFDGMYLKRQPTRQEAELMDCLFAYFGIASLKNILFSRVSAGEQRIILFLRALIKNPLLLLLDEPFQAFDPSTIEKAKELLNLFGDEHRSMIFITHYAGEIPDCVDHVMNIEKGKVISEN
ncbi:MAG: ATP-binding cassette domain-containing protein [Bacteroidota bacterium]|nr:ATP-binding cassette domain-containing protein [Bacteroidota bacterium]